MSLDNVFGLHATALRLRAQRTELLASNLANADTPNYKAKDMDFQAAMKQAVAGQSAGALKTTHAGHMTGSGTGGMEDYVKFRIPTQPALDGNTVETHVEQAAFSRNAMEYQATLRFLEGKSKSIVNAIKGES
jgi:flagellar basal-body rod protein FlgB